MRNLRGQAHHHASIAKARGDLPTSEYWKLVGVYGGYVARAIRRESSKRHKAREAGVLMDAIGVKSSPPPRTIKQYAGAEIFRAPPASHDECILEIDGHIFSPYVEPGDFVKVDFSVDNLRGDGLYLVSIYGYLAVCGFHKNIESWYVHESGEGMPRRVRMMKDREPEGYEIVGRILEVYKRGSMGASKAPSRDVKRTTPAAGALQ